MTAFLVGSAAASPVRTQDLYLWAGGGGPTPVGLSAVGWRERLAKHLQPGVYRIHVRAIEDMPIRLVGPRFRRQTRGRPDSGATAYETWTLRLRRGSYDYVALGRWAVLLRAQGSQIAGSFRVP